MPSSSEANDLPLFRDAPDALPTVSVQPWRSTPADAWTEEEAPSAAAIERHSPDLARRNLEFLRAMELHGKGAMASEIRSFREGHEGFIRHLVRWRAGADAGTGQASLALETLRELADLRRRILTGLDPTCLQRVMTAEARVRIRDREVERAISIAEFELAEERGEVVAIELSAHRGGSASPGVLEPDDAPSPLPPPALVEALEAAFPDGVIEPRWDESEGEMIYEGVRDELARLSGARILYERTMDGEERWLLGEHGDAPGSEEETEGPQGDRDEVERSYGLFFLTPGGREFLFEIEGEFLDEEGQLRPTTGVGRIGYAVAVSGIAPFALLRVTSLDFEEWFGTSSPDIESRYFDDAGRPQKEEHFLAAMLEEEAKRRLDDLRQRIMGVLAELGITVLSEEDVRRTVPGLEAADGVLVGGGKGAPPSVEEALFFRYL